jgi:hypothetical protein
MAQDVYAQIEAASRSGVAAVYLQQPCDAHSLERFTTRVQSELGETSAEWYMRLLRLTDGLQIDNSFLESAHDFIATNLEYRAIDPAFHRYLIFGHSGTVDMYVYDKERAEQRFCAVGFYNVEDVYEAYTSIEELLIRLLNAESVERQ